MKFDLGDVFSDFEDAHLGDLHANIRGGGSQHDQFMKTVDKTFRLFNI